MKKLILVAIAFMVSASAMAQSKPNPKDTFISINQNFTSLISIQPRSIVWHWGDNKMPMTWLPKPNMSNIDSVEIYVDKRLTYWLNDSTLIIKKTIK